MPNPNLSNEEIVRLTILRHKVDLGPFNLNLAALNRLARAGINNADFALWEFAASCMEGNPHRVLCDDPEMINRYRSLAEYLGASIDEVGGSDGLTRITLRPPTR